MAQALLQARGFAVVANASNGAEALTAADRAAPDAALVDVQLPDTDGLALAKALAEAHTSLRIILTSTDRTLVPAAALAASPALAFVPKDEIATADLTAWIGG